MLMLIAITVLSSTRLFLDLNTSHVNVNHPLDPLTTLYLPHLNTSHVNVNLNRMYQKKY